MSVTQRKEDALMKKLVCFLLTLVMILGLSACGGTSDDKTNADAVDDAAQQQEATDPAEANEPEDEEPVKLGRWVIDYYVDNFQQPTEDKFIANRTGPFVGTFSNSATQNSLLNVLVVVDADDLSFALYEYGGDNRVKNSSSRYDDAYNITMRLADGTEYSMSGTMYCGGDRVYVDDAYYDTVIEAFSQPDTNVAFYIEKADRTVTNYLFTVETSNFAELYQELT